MAEESRLEDLRKGIAEVTLEVFRLCGERLKLAKKIAEIKAHQNMPVEHPMVERELKRKVLGVCQTYGMDMNFCMNLLHLLLEESKRIQSDTLKKER